MEVTECQQASLHSVEDKNGGRILVEGNGEVAERVEGGQRHARVAVGVHEHVEATTHTLERDGHAAGGVAAAMHSGSGLAVSAWAGGVRARVVVVLVQGRAAHKANEPPSGVYFTKGLLPPG